MYVSCKLYHYLINRVPGHEAVGEVILSKRSGVKPGERLVFAALGGCGDCVNCKQLGHILDCTKLVRVGILDTYCVLHNMYYRIT